MGWASQDRLTLCTAVTEQTDKFQIHSGNMIANKTNPVGFVQRFFRIKKLNSILFCYVLFLLIQVQ